jgi:hypothetical protein
MNDKLTISTFQLFKLFPDAEAALWARPLFWACESAEGARWPCRSLTWTN